MTKEYLDAEGSPLAIGKMYTLITYGENGITPAHRSEWIKAIWNGSSLVDKEEGFSYPEWLNPPGEISVDVYPG